jgi:hypothetical protein
MFNSLLYELQYSPSHQKCESPVSVALPIQCINNFYQSNWYEVAAQCNITGISYEEGGTSFYKFNRSDITSSEISIFVLCNFFIRLHVSHLNL